MRSRLHRALRLLYLLLQHPLHLHRALVRRGLSLGWIDAVKPYVNSPAFKQPGLPVDDYASFQVVRYLLAARFREEFPVGEPWEHDYNPLLSHLWRREIHPLRWLKAAWHLRECSLVLEYGCGVAPYAHGVRTAWPFRQRIIVADLDWPLGYLAWRFRDDDAVTVAHLESIHALSYDGIVCTEVFEHLHDPVAVADWMTAYAKVVCFDYVVGLTPEEQVKREDTLAVFAKRGTLRGPDARGLFVWRAPSP